MASKEDEELEEHIEVENDPPAPDDDDNTDRLRCTEELDVEKEVFETQVPGALEHERENLVNPPYKRPLHRFKTELEPEDVRLVNELGQLNADQLMEYLRRIKDMACGLGQAQEDQCLRGKFMRIFKQ